MIRPLPQKQEPESSQRSIVLVIQSECNFREKKRDLTCDINAFENCT